MNTFLLILNIIINIIILINILSIKKSIKTMKRRNNVNKSNKRSEHVSVDDFDDDIEKYDNHSRRKKYDNFYTGDFDDIEDNHTNKNSQKIKNRCNNYKEKSVQMNTYYAFQDIYDFIEYVNNGNLKIVDIINEKVRTIINLDHHIDNGKKTILITFNDNTNAVFKPYLYAKYNNRI